MIQNKRKKSLDEFLAGVVNTDPRELKPNFSKELNEKMEWFKDMKFGFFVHYGLYSECGTMESWLMNKSSKWAREFDPRFKTEFNGDDEAYIQWYLDASKRMNPSKYDAKKWIDLVEETGCKYFAFTSKHHDGYCLFDSKYSNFKITNDDSTKKVDMLKELFDEADSRGLGKWLYFSKADWTIDSWQGPCYYDHKDVHLDPKDAPVMDPEIWGKFKDFFRNQVHELLTNYGRIDCLWLDSGWMRPDSGYDLEMDKVLSEAREMQKGLIVVDRADHRNEDYWTPEQHIITDPILNTPWESCISLGDHWGWTSWDEYKDENWVIDSLLNNISLGGNLNLGIGPKGDGSFPDEVLRILKAVGEFTKLNGEGIYKTRPIAPYNNEQAYFTKTKDSKKIFAFVDNKYDALDLPKEFGDITSATTVTGKKLLIDNNKINLSEYKTNKFDYRLVILNK